MRRGDVCLSFVRTKRSPAEKKNGGEWGTEEEETTENAKWTLKNKITIKQNTSENEGDDIAGDCNDKMKTGEK